jgi:hypothetical protein
VTIGDDPADAGITAHEHLARVDRSRVALVLMGGELSEEQDLELNRLEAVGCRVIPVILPNAPNELSMPFALTQWKRHHDFRRKVADIEALASDVTFAFEKGRLPASTGHVFLSYSRADHAVIERLVQQLEKAGHEVWWDRGHTQPGPGSRWQDVIRNAIKESYAFIWCVSRSSLTRAQSWMYPEIDAAIDIQSTLPRFRTFIIPVRLSDCDIPDIEINSRTTMRQLQWFDYFESTRNISGLARELDKARREAASGSVDPPIEAGSIPS